MLAAVEDGTAPADGFYTATIMFDQHAFNERGNIDALQEALDQLQPYVDADRAV